MYPTAVGSDWFQAKVYLEALRACEMTSYARVCVSIGVLPLPLRLLSPQRLPLIGRLVAKGGVTRSGHGVDRVLPWPLIGVRALSLSGNALAR